MLALFGVVWCGVLPVKAEDGVFGDELEQPPLQLSGKRRHPGLGDAGHVGLKDRIRQSLLIDPPRVDFKVGIFVVGNESEKGFGNF
jgi:hypothetical protein